MMYVSYVCNANAYLVNRAPASGGEREGTASAPRKIDLWRILGGYPSAFAAGSVLNAASVHQSYYLFEHSAGLACNVVEQMDGENLDVRNVIEWEQNLGRV